MQQQKQAAGKQLPLRCPPFSSPTNFSGGSPSLPLHLQSSLLLLVRHCCCCCCCYCYVCCCCCWGLCACVGFYRVYVHTSGNGNWQADGSDRDVQVIWSLRPAAAEQQPSAAAAGEEEESPVVHLLCGDTDNWRGYRAPADIYRGRYMVRRIKQPASSNSSSSNNNNRSCCARCVCMCSLRCMYTGV